MTDASRIEDRYWTCVDGEYVWWFGPQAGRGRACHINGDEDRSNVQEGEFQAGQDDDMPLTNTEARAILGDKWPATWPPGEGAVESTTAPATGNDPDAARHTPGEIKVAEFPVNEPGRNHDRYLYSVDNMTCIGKVHRLDEYKALPPDPEGKANADRLVACWNACAGMADPAATIRELREGLRLAVAENEAWRAWAQAVAGCADCPPENECHEDCQRLVSDSRERLDKSLAATDANATIAGVRKEIAP